MSRHTAREAAMCQVFEKSFGVSRDEMTELLKTDFKFDKGDEEYVTFICDGVFSHIDTIDGSIQKNALDWSLDRMAKVDLAIMRVAVFEILYADDIAETVSINEAVELAKKYSTQQSPQFINGILDSIYKAKGKSEVMDNGTDN